MRSHRPASNRVVVTTTVTVGSTPLFAHGHASGPRAQLPSGHVNGAALLHWARQSLEHEYGALLHRFLVDSAHGQSDMVL